MFDSSCDGPRAACPSLDAYLAARRNICLGHANCTLFWKERTQKNDNQKNYSFVDLEHLSSRHHENNGYFL